MLISLQVANEFPVTIMSFKERSLTWATICNLILKYIICRSSLKIGDCNFILRQTVLCHWLGKKLLVSYVLTHHLNHNIISANNTIHVASISVTSSLYFSISITYNYVRNLFVWIYASFVSPSSRYTSHLKLLLQIDDHNNFCNI